MSDSRNEPTQLDPSTGRRPVLTYDPDQFTIVADDPALRLLVTQHDLRQRFLDALTSILDAVDLNAAQTITAEAIDDDAIAAWQEAGRPLSTDSDPELVEEARIVQNAWEDSVADISR